MSFFLQKYRPARFYKRSSMLLIYKHKEKMVFKDTQQQMLGLCHVMDSEAQQWEWLKNLHFPSSNWRGRAHRERERENVILDRVQSPGTKTRYQDGISKSWSFIDIVFLIAFIFFPQKKCS